MGAQWALPTEGERGWYSGMVLRHSQVLRPIYSVYGESNMNLKCQSNCNCKDSNSKNVGEGMGCVCKEY